MSLGSQTWIAVNCQPHREGLALEHLARQGFAAYCPMIRKRVSHARRTREVLRPLFAGYLFVDIAPKKGSWRPILSTVGVRAVVRSGDELSRVPADFIASLRAREIDGAITPPPVRLELGQEVQINAGAFEGLVGRIVAMDGKERLTILMNLLNQSVRVKVVAGQVGKAGR